MILSERKQSEKVTYYMITTIQHSGKGKTMEKVKRSVVARSLGGRGGINRQSTEDFQGSEKKPVRYYYDEYMLLHVC